MAEKGLMTVNKLLEKLNHSISYNSFFQKYLSLKKDKFELAELLIQQEYGHPDIPRLQSKLISNEEVHELDDISVDTKQLKRILSILKLAKSHDPHNENIDRFIQFYEFVLNEDALNTLKHLAHKQSRALRRHKFASFLKYYEKEKIFQYHLLSKIHDFNIPHMFVETIKARNKVDFYEAPLETKAQVLGTSLIFLVVVAIGTTVSASVPETISFWSGVIGTTAVLSDTFFINKFLDIRLLAQRNRQLKNRPILSDSSMNKIAEIDKKYGVKVCGLLTDEELSYVEEALAVHSPIEVKNFLKTIYFRPHDVHEKDITHQSRGGVASETRASYDKHTRVIEFHKPTRRIIFHELAHGRVYALPRSFYEYWESINNKNVLRDVASEKTKKDMRGYSLRWLETHFENSPGYGYARAYGVTNIDEDIATMVDLLSLFDDQTAIHIAKKEIFQPYISVYQQKAHLLLKFGLITSKSFEKFIHFLKRS